MVDADDLLEPTYLERSLQALESRPDLAFASHWLRAFGDETWDWTPTDCGFPALLHANTLNGAALMRREMFERVGGFDETMVDGCEDWEFWIRVVEAGFTGVIIPEFLFRYRRRADSMSRTMHAVPGMPALYRQLVDRHPDLFARHLVALLGHRDDEIASLSTSLWRHGAALGSPISKAASSGCATTMQVPAAGRRLSAGRAGAPTRSRHAAEVDALREAVQREREMQAALRASWSWRLTTAAARAGRMGAAMISLGAIVVAGAAPRTARSLDSLVRQTRALDRVVIVVAPDIDRRVGDWLDATASARGWTLRPGIGSHPGRRMNAGLAACPTEWFVVLEAGDMLPAGAAAAFDAAVTGVSDPADFVVGAARLGGRSASTTRPVVDAPDDLAAFDPAHPALRSIWWRRSAVDAAGGFDIPLTAAVRYDLWLQADRERRRGHGACQTPSFALSVDEGEPLPAELESAGYGDAVRAVLTRHAGLLGDRVGAVLETRARRVTTLGPRHLRVLERHRAVRGRGRAPERDGPPPVGSCVDRADLPAVAQLGLRARRPSRPRLHRAVRPRARGRHPGRGARSAGGRLHAPLRWLRRRAQRRRRPRRVQRRRDRDHGPACGGQYSGRHVRLRDPDPDAPRHRADERGRRRVSPHPEAGRGPAGDAAVRQPRLSRIRARRRLLARHTGRRAAAVRGGVGDGVAVSVFGNVLAGAAFLYGLERVRTGRARPGRYRHLQPDAGRRPCGEARGAVPTAPAIAAASARPWAGAALPPGGWRRAGSPSHQRRPRRVRAADGVAGVRLRGAAAAGTGGARQSPHAAEPCGRPDLRRRLPGHADQRQARSCRGTGLPATCFVATEGLDGSHVFWWDRLAALLLGDGARPEESAARPARWPAPAGDGDTW